MADGYLPNAELLRLLKSAGKQHKTSFQPRPVGGRRSRHQGVHSNRPEQPRLIRGKVFADVAAGDASFEIDHIVALASGNDPRSDSGDDTERLTVASNLKETLTAGEDVTAIYSPAVIPATDSDPAVDWELVVVERFRAIRGTWYSGTTTLSIKNIVPLESGTDPRTDPTDVDEVVSVNNVAGDTYAGGDKVYADWNAKDAVWEARPQGGGGGGGGVAKIGKAAGTIDARTGTTAGSGDVEIWTISGTTLTASGVTETWYNIASQSVAGSTFLQAKQIDGQMVIDFEDCPS